MRLKMIISINIDEETLQKIDLLAEKDNRTRSNYIEQTLKKWITSKENYEKQKKD